MTGRLFGVTRPWWQPLARLSGDRGVAGPLRPPVTGLCDSTLHEPGRPVLRCDGTAGHTGDHGCSQTGARWHPAATHARSGDRVTTGLLEALRAYFMTLDESLRRVKG